MANQSYSMTYLFRFIGVSFVFTFLIHSLSNAQDVDSLKQMLLHQKDDTIKAELLYSIAKKLAANNETITLSEVYLDEYNSLSQKIGYWRGLVKYYDTKGQTLRSISQYAEAIDSHFKALELAEKHNLREMMPRIYNNIGVIYRRIDDYSNGLSYHLKALQLAEKINDTETYSYACNSIGNIYSLMKQYDLAIEYFNKSLDIAIKTNNDRSKAINYNNIGEVYEFMGNYSEALHYYTLSLEYNQKINNIKGLGISYDCIGTIYKKLKQFDKSLEFYKKGAEMHRTHKEHLFYSISLKNIASIYLEINQLQSAEKYLQEALTFALKSSSKTTLSQVYKLLSILEEKRDNCKKSLLFERLHSIYSDSVWNDENSSKLTKLQAAYNSEKQKSAIEKLELEKVLNEKTIERKNIQNLFLIVSIIFISIILVVIFQNYRQKEKINHHLASQAELILKKNRALERQKKRIESFNNRITDSLNYAQRIQQALLPSENVIKATFKDHFIFHRPLEIVSGDFYWIHKRNNEIIFAVADSTGHGVPGALMSMLGISFLNELALNSAISSASDFLNQLRDSVIKSLNQVGAIQELKEGISISLCIIRPDENRIYYSGAQNFMIASYFDGSTYELVTFYGDKMPIGLYPKMNTFKEEVISMHNLRTLYLFTDGFIDQFGDKTNTRYQTANFIRLLKNICPLPMEEQRDRLQNEFESWKGRSEQIDDVLVIGIQI